ncbi:MAG: AI-2E family transporter [Planctomycetes bacterium]|nr:AI-2E family transporter [Planctomycetota bacterium]
MENDLRKHGPRLALFALLALAVLTAVYLLREITAPVLGGYLLAYFLDPIARALARFRIGPVRLRRGAAVILIFGVVFVAGAAVLTTAGIALADWLEGIYHDMKGEARFAEKAFAPPEARFDEARGVWFVDGNGNGAFEPGYVPLAREKLQDWARSSPFVEATAGFFEREMAPGGIFDPEMLRARAIEAAKQLPAFIAARAGGDAGGSRAGEGGSAFFSFFAWFMLCPLSAFFFLLHFEAISERIRRYLPARGRPRIERVLGRIDVVLGKFLRGRLIACLLKGLLTALGLWICGLDYWLPIGVAAGFLGLIPYVGILAAALPALFLCWLEYESFARLGAVAGVFLAMEAIEGFVLVPLLLGKEIGLHPLTVLITLFIFGELFGIVGVLLSVPLAAISKILGEEFLLPFLRESADEKLDRAT